MLMVDRRMIFQNVHILSLEYVNILHGSRSSTDVSLEEDLVITKVIVIGRLEGQS